MGMGMGMRLDELGYRCTLTTSVGWSICVLEGFSY